MLKKKRIVPSGRIELPSSSLRRTRTTTVLRRLAISVAALNERLLLEGGTAYIIRLVLVLIWMEARLLVLHQVVQGRVVNHNTRVLPRKTLPYCHHS